MRFAAVQFDIVWEDKPANHALIERLLDEAAIAPGTFVLLPEMGDTGFSFNLDRIVDKQSVEWGCRVAHERAIAMQIGHAERGADGRGRNCATIISPRGEVVAQYQKVHPFSYGREIEHFSGGDHLEIVSANEGEVCPLICYDLRFPELWRVAAQNGASVFTIGASWPASRQHHWQTLLIARAIENQAYVVGVNRVGSDPHLDYVGGSAIISPTGEVIAQAGREPQVIQAELDMAALAKWRESFPALLDIRPTLMGKWEVRRAALPK